MDRYLLIYELVSADHDDDLFVGAILALTSARRILTRTWTFQAQDTDASRLTSQLQRHAGDRVRFVICRTEGCGIHQLEASIFAD